MIKIKHIVLAVVLIVTLTVAIKPLQSQGFNEVGLAVRPAITEVIGEKGKTTTTEVEIENISVDAVAVSIGSRSLLPNDPEIDQSRRGDFDASLWIKPQNDSLLLERGQSRTALVDIVVPEDAGPGGHYALITYRAVDAGSVNSSDSSTIANPELTTTLFITVPGLIEETAEASIDQPGRFNLNRTQPANIMFSNTGNIHLLPRAEVEIRNGKDELVEIIRPASELTLPNTIKTLDLEWSPEGRSGQFYYNVRLSYGTPAQQIEFRTESFWVSPPLLTLFFIGSIIGIVIFALITHERWNRAGQKLSGAPIKPTSTDIEPDLKEKQAKINPEALDELGKDRKLPDTPKTRKVEIKDETDINIDNETQSSQQHKDYITKVTKKPKK